MTFSVKRALVSVAVAIVPLLGLAADLPARRTVPIVDGDPREAFLQGAEALPMFDAVSGARDGSLRAYAFGVPDGLYVALLSAEIEGTSLLLPPPGARGSDLILGEWMAVRVRTAEGAGALDRLFALLPDGRRVCLTGEGTPASLSESNWAGAVKLFGFTWAGEWLLPWESLGLKSGATFRVEILRGRRRGFKGWTLEILSRSSPGAGASRWGGEGIALKVPEAFPPPLEGLYALEPFEVRPYVSIGELEASCESSVPAGEVATAWLTWHGAGEALRLEAGPVSEPARKNPPKISLVDFWWQAGRRVEQDGYFPARVAAGEGDVYVAERLFPQEASGAACRAGEEIRYLVSWRVPRAMKPSSVLVPIRMTRAGRPVGQVAWKIAVTPPLPDGPFLAGIYYLTQDQSRWDVDLADIKDHGFTAVTCPASDQAGWELFKSVARKHGLDGGFALNPTGLAPQPGDWAYVWDEPGTTEALAQAEKRAAELASKGWKTWAALCWRPLGRLPDLLTACSLAPNLTAEGASLPKPKGACWTYIQGLREDPAYNRMQMGRVAYENGLSGVWVFCYRPEPVGKADDWQALPLRYDACLLPARGGSVSTVEWEACRQGILEGRLLRAGGVP